VSSIIFFRAYAIFIFHKDFFSCRVLEGQVKICCTRQKKKYGLIEEKRDAAFHLRVFRYTPDRAVFSAAVNNINYKMILF
jgi:hypothetical protein